MRNRVNGKVHMSRTGRLITRATALVLALSMVLPMTAFGLDAQYRPTEPVEGELPTINLQVNAVVDRGGHLTGELEVGIRVKTGYVYYDNSGEPVAATAALKADSVTLKEGYTRDYQYLDNLSVALKYSGALTPAKWTTKDGARETLLAAGDQFTGNGAGTAVAGAHTNGFAPANMHNMPAPDIEDANVTAHVSQLHDSKGGFLFLYAEIDKPEVELNDEDGTLLGAVTFTYKVEDFADLLLTSATSATVVDKYLNPASTNAGANCLVQLATYEELNREYAKSEFLYTSSNKANGNVFYYTTATDNAYKVQAVKSDGTTLDYDCNKMVLSTDYTTVEAERINFSLVNEETFLNKGLTLGDTAIILFYDWDDTLLGALTVEHNADMRKMVNDYVRDNFIHPDIVGQLDKTGVKDASLYGPEKLTRLANYRGKYPTTAMTEDAGKNDPSVVTDGEDYPLTSHLDYVFFKRPMEKQDDLGNVATKPVRSGYANDSDYETALSTWEAYDTWAQADDGSGSAKWETEYPYVYGWAIVDYKHPENTWTTLGMGELTSYNGSDGSGGYRTGGLGTAPAEFTVDGEKFEFADFNFSKEGNSQEAGSIYAVKAVYEPGEDLMNSYNQYRILTENPYYIKLNNASAKSGGAYSITITAERSYEDVNVDSKIHGLARLREPVVRQDSTYDNLWTYIEPRDILHDIDGPDKTSAYTDKDQTVYSRIDVENKDIIEFSLILSARLQRVDYYVMEAYGSNFVAGNTQTVNDSTRKQAATIAGNEKWNKRGITLTGTTKKNTVGVFDNYNYYVTGQSNEDDEWYDAPYSEREGSLGFVLYGTLNQMMETATNYQPTDATFRRVVTEDALFDANIRFADGSIPNDDDDTTKDMRVLIYNAAMAAKAYHTANPTTTKYWNVSKNCAQLTYHQLQGFIIDGSLDHDEGPVTNLTWCHLHKECVDVNSTRPNNWVDIIAAARDNTLKDYAYTYTELEAMTHLRADGNGATIAGGVDGYKGAIRTAVLALAPASGTPTWDQVQDYIIRGAQSDAVAYSQAHYYWYDGTSSVTFSSLADTISAAKDAVTAVATVDGVTATRTAKINLLETVFNRNKTDVDDDKDVTAAWLAATENLCADDEGNTFADFETFRDLFVDALTKAGSGTPTWYQIQYHILHKDDPGYTFPTAAVAEAEGTATATQYWWHNGGFLIDSFANLVKAARQNKLSATTFTKNDLYSTTNTAFQFRSDFAGTEYENVGTFIAAFMRYVSAETAGYESWERAQFYLIHGGMAGSGDITQEAQHYYWWKNNGAPDPDKVTFSLTQTKAEDRANALAVALINAAFRAKYNDSIASNAGSSTYWTNLSSDFAAIMEKGRLVAAVGTDAAAFTADFTMYGVGSGPSQSDLIDQLLAMLPSTLTVSPTEAVAVPAYTWKQIQHYLLTHPSTVADDDDITDNYWWKKDNTLQAETTKEEDFATLNSKLEAAITSGDFSEFVSWFTAERAEKMEFTMDGSTLLSDDDIASIDWSGLGLTEGLTWAQYQCIFVTAFVEGDPYYTDDDEASGIVGDGYSIEIPSWPYSSGARQGNLFWDDEEESASLTMQEDGDDLADRLAAKDEYIAELEAQLAAKDEYIAELEAQLEALTAQEPQTVEPEGIVEEEPTVEPIEPQEPQETVEPEEVPEEPAKEEEEPVAPSPEPQEPIEETEEEPVDDILVLLPDIPETEETKTEGDEEPMPLIVDTALPRGQTVSPRLFLWDSPPGDPGGSPLIVARVCFRQEVVS